MKQHQKMPAKDKINKNAATPPARGLLRNELAYWNKKMTKNRPSCLNLNKSFGERDNLSKSPILKNRPKTGWNGGDSRQSVQSKKPEEVRTRKGRLTNPKSKKGRNKGNEDFGRIEDAGKDSGSPLKGVGGKIALEHLATPKKLAQNMGSWFEQNRESYNQERQDRAWKRHLYGRFNGF